MDYLFFDNDPKGQRWLLDKLSKYGRANSLMLEIDAPKDSGIPDYYLMVFYIFKEPDSICRFSVVYLCFNNSIPDQKIELNFHRAVAAFTNQYQYIEGKELYRSSTRIVGFWTDREYPSNRAENLRDFLHIEGILHQLATYEPDKATTASHMLIAEARLRGRSQIC